MLTERDNLLQTLYNPITNCNQKIIQNSVKISSKHPKNPERKLRKITQKMLIFKNNKQS